MTKQLLRGLVVAWAVTGTLWAEGDPFMGKWKMDASKSTTVDEMKVESAGGNKYGFDFGGGIPEMIAVDGTDQPGQFGTTLAVTAVTPDQWKVVRKQKGQIEIIGNWTLSSDGATLTDDYTEFDAKGSPTTHLLYKYQRMGGGSGFAADWVTTNQPTNPEELQIEAWQGDGLSLIRRNVARHVKFDGKDYAPEGGSLPAGFATSAQRVDAHTVELKDKIGARLLDTQELKLSADGKVLTVTYEPAGRTKPNVLVFERQ